MFRKNTVAPVADAAADLNATRSMALTRAVRVVMVLIFVAAMIVLAEVATFAVPLLAMRMSYDMEVSLQRSADYDAQDEPQTASLGAASTL